MTRDSNLSLLSHPLYYLRAGLCDASEDYFKLPFIALAAFIVIQLITVLGLAKLPEFVHVPLPHPNLLVLFITLLRLYGAVRAPYLPNSSSQ